MTDQQDTNTGAGGGSGGDASEQAAAVERERLAAEARAALEALPKVRLAHHPTLRVAVPDTDRTEPAFRTPVTVEGVANVYGLPPIYFPDAETQKAGFVPMFVATLGGRVTNARFKPFDGRRFHYLTGVRTAAGELVELDVDSAHEATRAVLTQFAGAYKPVEEKKGVNADA